MKAKRLKAEERVLLQRYAGVLGLYIASEVTRHAWCDADNKVRSTRAALDERVKRYVFDKADESFHAVSAALRWFFNEGNGKVSVDVKEVYTTYVVASVSFAYENAYRKGTKLRRVRNAVPCDERECEGCNGCAMFVCGCVKVPASEINQELCAYQLACAEVEQARLREDAASEREDAACAAVGLDSSSVSEAWRLVDKLKDTEEGRMALSKCGITL